jgi:glutathione S-transferase
MNDRITLHHLEYSQSFRVLWMLEELNLDYDLVVHDRDSKTMAASDEYKALSPLGTAPVITQGDLGDGREQRDYGPHTRPNITSHAQARG